MLEMIRPSAKEIQYDQTSDRCKINGQIRVFGKNKFISSVIDRIDSLIYGIEGSFSKDCRPSIPIGKNRINHLSMKNNCQSIYQEKVGVKQKSIEPQRVVIQHSSRQLEKEVKITAVGVEANSLCALGEASERFLGLLEKNLGYEGAAPWRALLNHFCRIHGSDKLQHIHQDLDGTYTLQLSEPLRIWMHSTDKNREDPLGGIVLMLGANQYQPIRREKLLGFQMKFQLLEKEIRFLGGLEIFIKTPAWARPLTLYQMQDYDYTDVVSYKVNKDRAIITAQYETTIVTAPKAREKKINHLKVAWGGHSLTHPTEVLPSCPPNQIKVTAQASIQKHLNHHPSQAEKKEKRKRGQA